MQPSHSFSGKTGRKEAMQPLQNFSQNVVHRKGIMKHHSSSEKVACQEEMKQHHTISLGKKPRGKGLGNHHSFTGKGCLQERG